MKATKIIHILFILLLTLMTSSNAFAELSDAFAMAQALFRFKNQDLFNIHSPILPGEAGTENLAGNGRFLLAQNQTTEPDDSTTTSGKPSAFESADEAARQSSNPLGGQFIILLNQFDNYAMQGDITDKTRWINNWAFQPVVPVPMEKVIGKNWIWVNRPTFNFVLNADLPDVGRLDGGLGPGNIPGLPEDADNGVPPGGLPFDSHSGFGDIIYFTLLGQSLPQQRWGGGDFVWAAGLTTQFPTASKEELGTGKYSIGPSGVLAFIGRKFILGGLYQHWLSYASGGEGADENVNFSWLNMFYFLNLEDGWQVGGTPVLTANWESDDSDDRFTIPVGLGVYKTHFFGKMPAKLGVEMQWMPVSPDDFGQEWNIRVVIAPIVPSFFK